MSHPFISRIAPTPSGYLHLGNAFNFLLTALLVDWHSGHLHLRIDDLDGSRVESSAVDDIFVQLEWLGIEYNSGPSGPDELFKQFSQHTRKESYYKTLDILARSGHLFACECTRSEIRQLSSDGNYPGTCRSKGLDFQHDKLNWRVYVPDQTFVSLKTITNKIEKINVSQAMGDFVVKRSDGLPSYQLASVVDDLEFGVNLVVRGSDLYASSAAQLFISKCLNDPIFPAVSFVHHKLITDNFGDKLSKSAGALSLKMLREKHQSPTWIYQETAKKLDLPFEEIRTLDDLKGVFRRSMFEKDSLLTLLEQGK